LQRGVLKSQKECGQKSVRRTIMGKMRRKKRIGLKRLIGKKRKGGASDTEATRKKRVERLQSDLWCGGGKKIDEEKSCQGEEMSLTCKRSKKTDSEEGGEEGQSRRGGKEHNIVLSWVG